MVGDRPRDWAAALRPLVAKQSCGRPLISALPERVPPAIPPGTRSLRRICCRTGTMWHARRRPDRERSKGQVDLLVQLPFKRRSI